MKLGERLALYQVLAGYNTHYYYMPGTTTKLSTLFQVLVLSRVTLEIFFLGLGLTVTEINIKKVQKQDLNIKNVKRSGMASLVPRRGGGGGESAWYTLFALLALYHWIQNRHHQEVK